MYMPLNGHHSIFRHTWMAKNCSTTRMTEAASATGLTTNHSMSYSTLGGSWGGMNGVDEGALPCTMEVEYVRVFQKK